MHPLLAIQYSCGHQVLGFNIWTSNVLWASNGPSEARQSSLQTQSALAVLLTDCVPLGPGAGRPRRWCYVSLHCPPLASHPTAEARWSVRSECSPPSSPWLCGWKEGERVTVLDSSLQRSYSDAMIKVHGGCVPARTTQGGGRDLPPNPTPRPRNRGTCWNILEHLLNLRRNLYVIPGTYIYQDGKEIIYW